MELLKGNIYLLKIHTFTTLPGIILHRVISLDLFLCVCLCQVWPLSHKVLVSTVNHGKQTWGPFQKAV